MPERARAALPAFSTQQDLLRVGWPVELRRKHSISPGRNVRELSALPPVR
jgi:hypothetical protein